MSTPSPARLDANRRNAQRSTGPRTPEGKARSAQNALQHGAYATDATIAALPTSPYLDTLSRYITLFSPASPQEALYVERAAALDARLQLVRAALDALLALNERRALADCLAEQYNLDRPNAQLSGQPRWYAPLRHYDAAHAVTVDHAAAGPDHADDVAAADPAAEPVPDPTADDAWAAAAAASCIDGAATCTHHAADPACVADTADPDCVADIADPGHDALDPDLAACTLAYTLTAPRGLALLSHEAALDRRLHAALTALDRLQRRRETKPARAATPPDAPAAAARRATPTPAERLAALLLAQPPIPATTPAGPAAAPAGPTAAPADSAATAADPAATAAGPAAAPADSAATAAGPASSALDLYDAHLAGVPAAAPNDAIADTPTSAAAHDPRPAAPVGAAHAHSANEPTASVPGDPVTDTDATQPPPAPAITPAPAPAITRTIEPAASPTPESRAPAIHDATIPPSTRNEAIAPRAPATATATPAHTLGARNEPSGSIRT